MTASLQNQQLVSISSFEIVKQIYTSGMLASLKLSPSSKLVLIALANHYNPNKPDMFPSQDYLSKQLGISPRSIARAIKELSLVGVVIYETKNVNRYKFTSKFFDLAKLAYNTGQIDKSNYANLANKQIREKLNNDNFKDFKKPKYYHNTQETGVNYKSPEQTKQEITQSLPVKKSSPLDFNKEQALDWCKTLPPILKANSIFYRQVCEKWGFTEKELSC